jgi:membrane protein
MQTARAIFKRAFVVVKHTAAGFSKDHVTQLAASISYYVLFSLIPLAIFVVSIFGFVVRDEGVREEIIETLLADLPLTANGGRSAIEDALTGVSDASGTASVLALIATLWTASTVFGVTRRSLNFIWKEETPRPFVQAKLIDFLQIGGLLLFLIASIVLTGFLRALRELSGDHIGAFARDNVLWEIPFILVPALMTFIVFAVLYHIVPARRPGWRLVLPGAILATVLFELLKNSFALYVANFGNYDPVYGSLAGVLLFLFYMFLAANILLVGAEVSKAYEGLLRGDYAEDFEPSDEPSPPVRERAVRLVKGLFVRQ